ncbi:hypothetical protein LJR034_003078 [Caballeronia sp. LjRoot34]|uniref:hypothetical protein n=1 Tax=Caballeronia sp. LjRoot34 TaxID=3342325 RepID=UPI003ECD97E1
MKMLIRRSEMVVGQLEEASRLALVALQAGGRHFARGFGNYIPARSEEWREHALAGIDAGLKERENDPLEAKLGEATRRIGELVM